MNFYLLKNDPLLQDAPILSKLFQIFGIRQLYSIKFNLLPNKILIPVNFGISAVYPGTFVEPILLFRQDIWRIVQLYEPELNFIRVIFYDENGKKTLNYYMPKLDKKYVLSNNSEFNLNKSIITKAVFTDDPIDKNIFYLSGVNSINIAVSQDLIESILVRDFTGIFLQNIIFERND